VRGDLLPNPLDIFQEESRKRRMVNLSHQDEHLHPVLYQGDLLFQAV
jgi:hypothetical protein